MLRTSQLRHYLKVLVGVTGLFAGLLGRRGCTHVSHRPLLTIPWLESPSLVVISWPILAFIPQRRDNHCQGRCATNSSWVALDWLHASMQQDTILSWKSQTSWLLYLTKTSLYNFGKIQRKCQSESLNRWEQDVFYPKRNYMAIRVQGNEVGEVPQEKYLW